jgi:acyl carrier protein
MNNEQKIELIKKAYIYASPENVEKADSLDLQLPLEKLGIQSVTALEMAGFIEEELDIEFFDKELTELNKMQDLIDLIGKAQARKAG